MRLPDLLALRSVPAAGVYLSLTRRCPLHCAHCSTRSTMRSQQHDGGPFLALVDSFTAADHPAAVLMTGGEPLLRPRLVAEIAGRCRALGVATEVTTGGWFAARRRIPQAVDAALLAVDGVALSMDEWHQAEVPVADAVWLIDQLAGRRLDVSVQLTYRTPGDPWAADLERLLAGRVPVFSSLLAPVGRAAGWAGGRDGPAAEGGCDLATWPVVAFDGTIVACCSQRTVDGPVPAHLRLGVAGRDGWPAIRRRVERRDAVRAIRAFGPTWLAEEAGTPVCDGVCQTCHALEPATEALGAIMRRPVAALVEQLAGSAR